MPVTSLRKRLSATQHPCPAVLGHSGPPQAPGCGRGADPWMPPSAASRVWGRSLGSADRLREGRPGSLSPQLVCSGRASQGPGDGWGRQEEGIG